MVGTGKDQPVRTGPRTWEEVPAGGGERGGAGDGGVEGGVGEGSNGGDALDEDGVSVGMRVTLGKLCALSDERRRQRQRNMRTDEGGGETEGRKKEWKGVEAPNVTETRVPGPGDANENLDALVVKWRGAARIAAEELFEVARERVKE